LIPSIFDYFEKILIINLTSRTDRRSEMMDQLSKVGLLEDPRVIFFEATRTSDPGLFVSAGMHGCFQSHLRALQFAATSNQSVLILEDDCDFENDIFGYRTDGDWDIFYGGYSALGSTNLHEADIIGAHFMGFKAPAAKIAAEYLAGLLEKDAVPEPKAASEPSYNPSIRPPPDGAYVWLRRVHPELKTQFALLSKQRASRTDTGDLRFFDRIPILRDFARVARSLKRRLAD
jgi:glycosyl transferase, family 25